MNTWSLNCSIAADFQYSANKFFVLFFAREFCQKNHIQHNIIGWLRQLSMLSAYGQRRQIDFDLLTIYSRALFSNVLMLILILCCLLAWLMPGLCLSRSRTQILPLMVFWALKFLFVSSFYLLNACYIWDRWQICCSTNFLTRKRHAARINVHSYIKHISKIRQQAKRIYFALSVRLMCPFFLRSFIMISRRGWIWMNSA